jgi:hypothetical protein
MTNAIETTEAIQARLAAQLERQTESAVAMRSTGSYISFKNAILKVDGQPVPNNMAEVRVLAAVPERAYYIGEFDADAVQVPTCYALDSAEPHDEAAAPQAATCAECEHNKWGSATRGKGKACREGARVIVVPASVPLKSAQMSTAKVPVSSLSTVTNFVSRCSNANKLTGEFITQLSVVEDKKTFFKVHLNIKEHTADLDSGLLLAKQDEAYQLALTPYPTIDN